MLKKKISIICLILLAMSYSIFFLLTKEEFLYVNKVISPVEFILENNQKFFLKGIDYFDSYFSQKNKIYAEKFKISEEEAFIIGNLGKYWAKNLIENREVKIKEDNLIFFKYSYREKFLNSPFAIVNGESTNPAAFEKLINSIRKTKYVIIQDEKVFPISKDLELGDFVIIKKSAYNRVFKKKQKRNKNEFSEKILDIDFKNYKLDLGDIKIIVSDFTKNLKPDRDCKSEICKEILDNINSSKTSIDMAIYGYSSIPKIENAIKNAIKRGVKFRLIYDIDSKLQNIYPNTFDLVKLIPNSVNDKNSKEFNYIMHNKFYIFDNKTVITGSANLSHTDMSGYNSNSIIVIKSKDVAKIFQNEFEQMYLGNFHNDKKSISQINKPKNIEIYFSPQDKSYEKSIFPLIRNSKHYIYIPIFVLSEKRLVEELINANNRGIDVKIITDALNASAKYSKIKQLRDAGILVKTENYAGKMHSKTMIIDDEYLIIGSMNFSNSGKNKNDENLVILKNKEAAEFYKNYFLYHWNKISNKWLKYNPLAESKDSIGSCSDGIDNNYDGKIDKEDIHCK